MPIELISIVVAGLVGIIFGFLLAVLVRPAAAARRRPRFSAAAYGIKPDQLTRTIAELDASSDSPDRDSAQQIRWDRAISQVQRFVNSFPEMPTCRAFEDVTARLARSEGVSEREKIDALFAVVVTISALNYVGQRIFGEA